MTGITDQNRDAYLTYVKAYYDQMGLAIAAFTSEETHRFFVMIKEYADILIKLYPEIDLFQVANGADNGSTYPVVVAYREWLKSQGA